jgi:hypothetical protein
MSRSFFEVPIALRMFVFSSVLMAVAAAWLYFDAARCRAESPPPRAVRVEAKKPAPEKPTQKAAAEPPRPAKAAPAEDKGEPAGQLQPQAHASSAGITSCFDSLARASSHVIDGQHRAFSFWDPKKPDTGTFRSVVALRYGDAVSPRGAAVIVNSPMRDATCDATTIQVVPTARPCSAVQSGLIGRGKAVANLTGLALIQSPGDVSYLLLPTAGDGCAIVSMTVFRGN